MSYNMKKTTLPKCSPLVDEPIAITYNTCIGTFIFSQDIDNLQTFNSELTQTCFTELDIDISYELYKENLSISELCKVMCEIVWDEHELGVYNLPYVYHSIFEHADTQNEGSIMRQLLILSGDIETNPGPVQSRPSQYRDNDPRIVKLEKALERQQNKVRTLIKHLRHEVKRNNNVYVQMFGLSGDVKDLGKVIDNNGERLHQNLTRVCDFLENSLPGIVRKFTNTSYDFFSEIDSTTTSIDNNVDKVTNTMNSVANNLSSIKSDIIKIIVVCLLVKLLMSLKFNKLALALVLGFILKFYGFDKYTLELVEQLKNKLRGEEIQVQGMKEHIEDLIYSPYFEILGKILFSALAFISIKKIPGKNDWDTFISRLDRIPKAKKGATEIIDYCGEYFQAATDTIKMMVLGKSKEELTRANGLYMEIQEWAKEVRKYLDLEQRNKIDLDIEVANKVENLYKQGLKYQADPLLDREVARLVATTLLPARELYQYVSSSPVKGGGPRMRPICLWLVGESGVGKTEMVYPLCIDVLRAMGLVSPKDFHHQVYGRQVETEFWDGYKGQKIVIYDDAFQMKDDKTAPNPEIFEVIRSCNTFPQHLHMAALHDKNTFSAAELLLYTTNDYNVKLESITFPDAFYNRIGEHAYKVRPKLEYSIVTKKNNSTETYRKLDKSKLNKNVAIDLDVYEFVKIVRDPQGLGGWTETGEPIGYEEFSKMICDEWREQKTAFMRKLQFLNERASRPMVQMNCDESAFDFASDISSRLHKGETMMEIEADYAVDPEQFNAYQNWKASNVKPSAWDKYRNRIDLVLSDFNNFMNGLKIKIKNILSSHPYITALSFVGLIITGLGMYTTFNYYFNKKTNENETNNNDKIKRTNTKATRFVEVGTSGDHKTQKQSKPKIEIGTSGDSKTPRQQQKRVEIAQTYEEWEKEKEKSEEKLWTAKWMLGLMERMDDDQRRDFIQSVNPTLCEVGTSGDHKTAKQQQRRVEVGCEGGDDELDKTLHEHIVVQGCSDGAAHALVTDVLRKNTYRLTYERNGKRIPFGNCTFVRGWCFVIPYHFLHALNARQLPLDTIISFSQSRQRDIIQVELSHFFLRKGTEISLTKNCVRICAKDGTQRDCVMVNLHQKMCPPHRDLLKHFVKVEDQGKLIGNFSGVLATYHESGEELCRTYQWLQQIRPCDKAIEIFYPNDQYDYGTESFLQRECYEYNAPTQVGDCGSLIGIYNHRIERKIIGMHIAGSSQEYGYACPLTQESLEAAMDTLINKDIRNISAQFYYKVPETVDAKGEPNLPEGLFVGLGVAEKPVGQAIKTNIVPSAIHGLIFEPITRPALLRPTTINGVSVDPLLNGLKKCGVSTAILTENEVLSAAQNVCQIVLSNYNSSVDRRKYRRFLTYEEAIRGTLDDDFMRPINRRTSPGYPYCLQTRKGPGKTDWMGSDDNFDFTSPRALQLRSDVQRLLDDCEKGIITGVVFVDTLKDERREHKKVDVGKTRVFSAGPQHFVVAFRQYFLPFAAYLMHNRIDNEVCVGTNPYSVDWERIARKLSLKGPNVIAGDFSNFDGSLVAQILWAIFWEIFVPWMRTFVKLESEEGRKHLKVTLGLWTHLVHSVHIFKDNVYMWTHSQPSGNPFTVIINCLYNSIIMRIAWIRIMLASEPKLVSMKHFNQHVSMVSYGDDNVLNISNDVLDLYNQETISAIMKTMKHEYTDEAKTGTIVKARKLDEIFFLKRGFKFSEELQRTVAPLKIEVIYEMLNWSRNTIDPNVILMTNIDVAMREIVYHGRTEYETLKAKLMECVDSLPKYPQILTYEQYLHDIEYLADAVYDF